MGGKITPCSILVMQNGTTKLINVKNQDAMTKVLDMVPDIINKFTAGKEETPVADAVEAEVKKQEANLAEQRIDGTFVVPHAYDKEKGSAA